MAKKKADKAEKGGEKAEKGGEKAEKGAKAEAKAAAPAPAPKAPAAESLASKVVEGVKNVVSTIAEKVTAVLPGGSDKPAEAAQQVGRRHGFRRKLVGRVTSNKMDKTVTVEVIRDALDPVYKKYVRRRERYKAHDATNQYKIGDRVEITEHRPISRDKRWLVTRLVSRPVEE
jgi:small subunit ribosomal protein S17